MMLFININTLEKSKISKSILLFVLFFNLFQSSSLAGEIKFSLLAISNDEKVQSNDLPINTWVMPIPNNLINQYSQITLIDSNNRTLQASFNIALLWPDENEQKYIRSLIISTSKHNISNANSSYSLKWQENNTETNQYDKNILSITHHAKLPSSWLALSFYAPLMTIGQNKIHTWFDHSHERYGKFIAEPYLVPKHKFDVNTASVWLYDRPFNFYLLYLKTGDIYWKTKAHEASDFYKNNINDDGYFSIKKPNDLKYANTQGLVLDYIFYPQLDTKEAIERIYKMTEIWPTKVKEEGFWTERHHSAALSSAISQWVMSNDKNTLKRIHSFVNNTDDFLRQPYNGSCLKHSYLAHEGKKRNSEVCSPWMTALLIEQFWRFYHLTFDYKSVFIIEKFSEFLTHQGVFHFTYGKEYSAVPKYLASLTPNVKENYSAWNDLHHACDVGAAIAKAAYLKKTQKKNYSLLKTTLKNMLKTCRRSMYRSNPNDAWPTTPPRKFNWWYGSTASFPWLLNKLNI